VEPSRHATRSRLRWVILFALLLLALAAVPALAAEPVPVGSSQSLDFRPPTREEEEFEALAPDGHDIAKALAEYEKEQREREERLKTPEAVKQREESRLGFADASPSVSEELFRAAFPRTLEALNSDPSRFLSDAKLVRSVGDSGAVVKAEGESSLLESTVPARTEDEEGKLAKVDLSLKATAGGFETDNAIADLRLPDSADKGMEVGEAGVEISQAGAANSAARRYGDKNLFYPEALPDTDLFASATSFGLELYDQLRSEDSPEELRFHIDVPDGAELRSDGRSGAEVLREGKRLTLIPKPFAKDAQGTDVPLESEVEGSALVVRIAHREGDYAYPILLDPIVEDWVNQGENWYGGDNWAALSSGAWQWERNNSNIGKNPANEWEWERCCWEGSHAGLLIDMRAAFYGPEQWGEWIYSTPNEHVYINHVWLIPFNRADEGCSSAAPHDYHGLWNPGDVWSPIWIDYAKTYGNNSGDGVGRKLVIGETSSSTGVWLACDRILYAGGVGIWLEDDYPPVIHSAGVPSGGWFGDQEATSIDVSSGDEGLGVQFVKVLNQGKGVVGEDHVGNCTGLYGARCPTDHESQFEVTGDSFGEGIRESSVTVSDPTGKTTESFFTTKVDNSPPEVALEGQLAQATKTEVGFSEGEPNQSEGDDKLTLPVYNLHIKAKDGNAKGTNIEKRSGVKDVKVKLDGKEMDVPWNPLSECPETSCERDVVYPLDLSQVEGGGVHKLEVIAEDFVGEKKERHIEFEYFPATGMKDEYMLQHFPLPDGQGNEDEEEHPARPELAVNVINGNLVYRQRDVDVEGPSVDLEVERFYNSMLPESQSTEWGKGWTLAQTPKLEPEGEEETPQNANMLRQTGAVERSVALPTESGQERFDPRLNATITKKSTGGYAVTEESGDTQGTLNFDSTGKTQALTTEGYAKVNYEYEEGDLSEIAVEDPGTYNADSAEIEELESGELEESEGGSGGPPSFVRSFGTYGSGNGQLNNPGDVARDAKGNLWVPDWGNERIEEFDPEGNYLSQFGESGSGNGQLNHPLGLAIDAEGDIWVVDHSNNRVEQFSPEGEYLSKFGTYGSSKGQFNGPEGIAIGPSGTIWVSDASRVQTFTQAGVATGVFAGHGTGEGQVGEPAGVDVDSEGDVWVADWGNNRVSVFSEEGEFLFQFGSYGSGEGQFEHPASIAIDSAGDAWVGDYEGNRIEKFSPSGEYLEEFGSAGSGPGEFDFGYPTGIAAGPNGNLWVADTGNDRIEQWGAPVAHRVFDEVLHQGTVGEEGAEEGQLEAPSDVARDSEGNLWVADWGNDRIEEFDPEGNFLSQIGESGAGNGQLNDPSALAIDAEGDIWVVDHHNNRVEQFSPQGEYLSKFGTYGSSKGQFNGPEGIAIGPSGTIWVSDTSRVQTFTQAGEATDVFAGKGTGEGQVGGPAGIDIGPGGDVWVADCANDRISVFAADGEFIRQIGSAGSNPGQFSCPDAIDVDDEGHVWVGDLGNDRIDLFEEDGEFVMQFGESGSGDEQLDLSYPTGIASDEDGLLWVADSGNHRVQEWLAGHASETEEEVPTEDDPKVEVDTQAGLVASVSGEEAGTNSYEHEGQELTAYSGPEGETAYEYDSEGRMTKVSLPNGTWGEIAYLADGRVKTVTVSVEGAKAKTTYFTYKDDSPRRTTVEPSDAPHVVYDIGDDGSVLKWWNEEQPPSLDLSGTLYDHREEDGAIWPGTHWLDATAESAEGIASIDVILNGNTVVHELTCEQDHEKKGIECENELTEWIAETDLLTPGHLWIEVIATDTLENSTSERFWVDIPEPPPPLANGTPVEPKFRDIKKFREEYGLEINFPVKNEIELNERIFNLIKAWNEPNTPAGQVARASMARWGVPLRPEDVAELEYREWLYDVNAEKIDQWVEATSPSSYAGYYLDHAAGGVMHIGFLGDQAGQLANLETSLSLVGGSSRLNVYPTPPTVSYVAIRESTESVMDAIESNSTLADLIVSVEDDEAGKATRVGTPNVAQVESILDQTLGASAPVTVEYEAGEGALLDGRYRNEGRMRAGDYINSDAYPFGGIVTGGRCTAGFGAEDRRPRSNGGEIIRLFLLTAGHCAAKIDGEVWRNTYDGDDEFPFDDAGKSEVGRIRRSALQYLEAGDVRTDGAAIRITQDGIVPQAIWGWDGQALPTKPAGRARKGNVVCYSGALSKNVACGKIVARSLNWHPEGAPFGLAGYWVRFPSGKHPVEGDSGSPVWNLRTGASIGLVSAGRPEDSLEETLVAPLLHPPNMLANRVPGILHHLGMEPLQLKLGG
jgi:YD repeat-containing protein